jgi:hypothetical protein
MRSKPGGVLDIATLPNTEADECGACADEELVEAPTYKEMPYTYI